MKFRFYVGYYNYWMHYLEVIGAFNDAGIAKKQAVSFVDMVDMYDSFVFTYDADKDLTAMYYVDKDGDISCRDCDDADKLIPLYAGFYERLKAVIGADAPTAPTAPTATPNNDRFAKFDAMFAEKMRMDNIAKYCYRSGRDKD